MRRQHLLWCRILWLGVMSLLVWGCASSTKLPDTVSLPQPTSPTPTTPASALQAFEAVVPSSERYLLGSGDKISLSVWRYPELSGEHTIGPDGAITVPLVGAMQIVNLNRQQVTDKILAALSSYYKRLTIDVQVTQYIANRILVLGRVKNPGTVQFNSTEPSLLEALALAGGIAETSGLTAAQALPLSRCAIFRGRDQIVWIDLAPLLTGKNLSLNMRLKRNDIVYVPDIEERLVYVLGQVERPGALPLQPNMSLLEAVAKAGGPTLDAAEGRMQLIRPSTGLNITLDFDNVVEDTTYNAALEEGDIIYVPTNTIAKLNYAVRFLSPFSQILSIYADIESIRADREQRKIDSDRESLDDARDALESEKAAFEQEKSAFEQETSSE